MSCTRVAEQDAGALTNLGMARAGDARVNGIFFWRKESKKHPENGLFIFLFQNKQIAHTPINHHPLDAFKLREPGFSHLRAPRVYDESPAHRVLLQLHGILFRKLIPQTVVELVVHLCGVEGELFLLHKKCQSLVTFVTCMSKQSESWILISALVTSSALDQRRQKQCVSDLGKPQHVLYRCRISTPR